MIRDRAWRRAQKYRQKKKIYNMVINQWSRGLDTVDEYHEFAKICSQQADSYPLCSKPWC